jgi:hypothetical protein
MNNRQKYMIIIMLFASIFIGSGVVVADNRATVSGSATAEIGSDGAVTTRDTTKEEITSLDKLRRNLNEIDQKYPGPQIPVNTKLLRVTAVDNSGNISLENGQQILLEGVRCPPQGITYLRRELIGESNRIVYTPSSSASQKPVRAYIWHANLSLMDDPELKKFKFGPAYSPLNEVVLTSDWCAPEKTSSNAYNDRYEALSKIAHH